MGRVPLPRAGTLASLVLVAVALPPMEWSGLIWIGLVPWLFALERSPTLGAAVAQGFWLNLLLGFTNAYPVASAVPRYLDVPTVVGIGALFLYALVHQLPLAIFAGLAWASRRARPPTSWAGLAASAALYTGIDWAMPKVFPVTFGHALHDFASLRQLAAFGGEHALTWLVMWVNLGVFALLRGVTALEPTLGGVLRRSAWVAAPVVLALGVGSLRLDSIREAIATAAVTVRVGMVQGNVPGPQRLRWARGDPEAARASLDVYVRATTELLHAADPPELVIWPETSYPGIFRKPESDPQLRLNVEFDRFVGAAGTPLVFGGYDRDERRDRRVLRNALYFVTPQPGQPATVPSPMQVYHKTILMPVGEYMPLVSEGTARRWLPGGAHLVPGAGPSVHELTLADGERLRLGPMICYEDLFASHALALAGSGAELLVNVSNDAWFGDYGARLHWIMARMRSVETGLSQVRVTNSGYSAVFLPDGAARHGTRFGARVAQTVDVPIPSVSPPLRRRLGDWLGPVCLAVGVTGLLLARPERT